MKRCPKCNRVETEDALTFCRVDGTPLARQPGSVVEGAGTLKFGSAPETGETGTRILPTGETPNRPTAPTTVLDRRRAGSGTQGLGTPKSRRVVVIAVAAAVALGAAAYLYLSRSKNSTIKNSIAVLPFQNASGDPDMEYLSDGITESLINSLSQLPNLAVKARSTVFRYKGKESDPQKVGSELNVQAVLNGRVVQRGNDLTLSLELVEATTGDQMWGGRYDRKLTDLVALQSEIARDVSDKLRVKLSGADERRLAKSHTEYYQAYQLYLQGQFYTNKQTPRDLQRAIEYFQQSVTVDPNYALAYAGIAQAYALPSNTYTPPQEAIPRAREAALKALALDEQLAEAHATYGFILQIYDYDFAGAEREVKRAIGLNPNYPTAHQWYARLLTSQGRHEEAAAKIRRALELDPLSLPINFYYGASLHYARKHEEALAQQKKTLELDANFALAHLGLYQVYLAKGDYTEGVEEFAKFQELVGNRPNAVLARESFAKGGRQGFLRAMSGAAQPTGLSSYLVATFHAALGETDKAFAELNRSYENREGFITYLKVDPRLDPLRSDPRFQDLMRRVGLSQ